MARPLVDAREILEQTGCADPAAWGAEVPGAEDRLGCSLRAQRAWLRTAAVAEIRAMGEDWAREEED